VGNICGDLRFGFTDVGNAQAEGFLPGVGAGGDVWFSYTEKSISFAEGSYNYLTLLHEIGHALGLKHPFAAGWFNPAVLPDWLDNQSYTLMSYSALGGYPYSDFTYRPTTPMVLDIQAIQYLYGANTGHNAANTLYGFSQGSNYHETIWDGGGRDTISYEGSDGCVIDLRQGAGSTLGNPVYAVDLYGHRTPVSNVWIANGAVIENASGGNGADRLAGNEVSNSLSGGMGSDTISGGGGNDRIDGGGGQDVAVFLGSSADYTVTFNPVTGRYAVGDRNRPRDGTDVVSGTELFQFSDGTRSASQLAIAAPVTGDAHTAIAISEAFFGIGPGPAQYSQALETLAAIGASQFALSIGNSFAATDSASLSTTVLANFGISSGTLGGGDPDASFAALHEAVTIIFSVYADARGQVVLNIGNLLAGLESNSVYGFAAAAFQNTIAADFSALSAGLVGVAHQEQAPLAWA
jgi:Ca2+-binding RTX toxin-like protein